MIRSCHPRLDPVAQPAGRPPAERQREDPVGRRAVGDPGGDRLHERGGLPGAGAAEHEQGAVAVLRHRPLRGIERDRRGGRRGRTQ